MNVITQIVEIVIRVVVALLPAFITAFLILKDAAESIKEKLLAAIFGLPASVVSIVLLIISLIK